MSSPPSVEEEQSWKTKSQRLGVLAAGERDFSVAVADMELIDTDEMEVDAIASRLVIRKNRTYTI